MSFHSHKRYGAGLKDPISGRIGRTRPARSKSARHPHLDFEAHWRVRLAAGLARPQAASGKPGSAPNRECGSHRLAR